MVGTVFLLLFLPLLHTAMGKFYLRASAQNGDGPQWANYGKSREVFFNDGRFYGWDSMHTENKGTVEEVSKYFLALDKISIVSILLNGLILDLDVIFRSGRNVLIIKSTVIHTV